MILVSYQFSDPTFEMLDLDTIEMLCPVELKLQS